MDSGPSNPQDKEPSSDGSINNSRNNPRGASDKDEKGKKRIRQKKDKKGGIGGSKNQGLEPLIREEDLNSGKTKLDVSNNISSWINGYLYEKVLQLRTSLFYNREKAVRRMINTLRKKNTGIYNSFFEELRDSVNSEEKNTFYFKDNPIIFNLALIVHDAYYHVIPLKLKREDWDKAKERLDNLIKKNSIRKNARNFQLHNTAPTLNYLLIDFFMRNGYKIPWSNQEGNEQGDKDMNFDFDILRSYLDGSEEETDEEYDNEYNDYNNPNNINNISVTKELKVMLYLIYEKNKNLFGILSQELSEKLRNDVYSELYTDDSYYKEVSVNELFTDVRMAVIMLLTYDQAIKRVIPGLGLLRNRLERFLYGNDNDEEIEIITKNNNSSQAKKNQRPTSTNNIPILNSIFSENNRLRDHPKTMTKIINKIREENFYLYFLMNFYWEENGFFINEKVGRITWPPRLFLKFYSGLDKELRELGKPKEYINYKSLADSIQALSDAWDQMGNNVSNDEIGHEHTYKHPIFELLGKNGGIEDMKVLEDEIIKYKKSLGKRINNVFPQHRMRIDPTREYKELPEVEEIIDAELDLMFMVMYPLLS